MITAAALMRACHPVPTAGVTALSVVLAVATGYDLGRATLVGVAVLAGQLSIGWSNDAIDAERDARAERSDKPVASGEVPRRMVAIAALVALLACVGLSLTLGLLAGAVHLVFVVCGWAYNLGVKRTVWSWAPYAIGFGALPCFVVFAAPGSPTPTWWLAVAGALLGVGAHLINVLPDLSDDLATGVRGWPHRLGRRRAMIAAVTALGLASVVLVVAPPGPASSGTLAVLGVALALVCGVTVLGLRRPDLGRLLIIGVLAIAMCDVVLLVVGAGRPN